MDGSGTMTCAQFAKLLGVSSSAVGSYISRGIIQRTADGRVNVAEALEGLRTKGDPRNPGTKRRNIKAIGTGGGTRVIEAPLLKDTDDLRTQKTKAQIAGLVHKARLAEIKADAADGELVSRALVDKEIFEVARIARNQIFTIADRVSAELAGLTSAAEIHARLTDEMRLVLTELSESLAKVALGGDE